MSILSPSCSFSGGFPFSGVPVLAILFEIQCSFIDVGHSWSVQFEWSVRVVPFVFGFEEWIMEASLFDNWNIVVLMS